MLFWYGNDKDLYRPIFAARNSDGYFAAQVCRLKIRVSSVDIHDIAKYFTLTLDTLTLADFVYTTLLIKLVA